MKAQVMKLAWELYRRYNVKSMSFWSKSLCEAWNYVRYDNRTVSEIEIPKGKEITLPDPQTGINAVMFSSEYDWNYDQLEDWKRQMIANWGNISLSIWSVNNRLIRYEADDDMFRESQRKNDEMVYNFINS